MALDRLIAEAALLTGVLYMGLYLYGMLNQTPTLDMLQTIKELGSVNLQVPDAVIVDSGAGLRLYLVIVNAGDEPVIIRNIVAQGNASIADTPTRLDPGKYVLITSNARSKSMRLIITACTVNGACILYPVNATYYPLH
jgi:hypothetical protein